MEAYDFGFEDDFDFGFEIIEPVRLFHGDCLAVLKTLDSESVDSLVTDPPAGISFMGKGWDDDKGGRDAWIAWLTDVMREAYRVLKPGAHGLVWAIPRTSHWTATALENAGFEVRDVVTHLFGTGFPKSLDVSKAIDKAAGAKREVIGKKAVSCGTGKDYGKAAGNTGRGTVIDVTAPATDAARKWQGFGTALKPASEHWILVRKPLGEKTVAANVLKHRTGAINVDGCRIATTDKLGGGMLNGTSKVGEGWDRPWRSNPDVIARQAKDTAEKVAKAETLGRFPANLVLSHNDDCEDACSQGCAVAALDGQAGHLHGAGNKSTRTEHAESASKFGMGGGAPTVLYDRGGGASRFFYCAKASKADRGTGNTHPTVKSTKLMGYLVRLVTPPGGTVLDPFVGSGSTGVAARAESFRFIGIEQEKDSFEIAKRRLAIGDLW